MDKHNSSILCHVAFFFWSEAGQIGGIASGCHQKPKLPSSESPHDPRWLLVLQLSGPDFRLAQEEAEEV